MGSKSAGVFRGALVEEVRAWGDWGPGSDGAGVGGGRLVDRQPAGLTLVGVP